MLNHKEMTKHIRTEIKTAGIKASVCKMTSCGCNYVRVSTATYEQSFTESEQQIINSIAKSSGLTLSRGMEIVVTAPFQQRGFNMPRG